VGDGNFGIRLGGGHSREEDGLQDKGEREGGIADESEW